MMIINIASIPVTASLWSWIAKSPPKPMWSLSLDIITVIKSHLQLSWTATTAISKCHGCRLSSLLDLPVTGAGIKLQGFGYMFVCFSLSAMFPFQLLELMAILLPQQFLWSSNFFVTRFYLWWLLLVRLWILRLCCIGLFFVISNVKRSDFYWPLRCGAVLSTVSFAKVAAMLEFISIPMTIN